MILNSPRSESEKDCTGKIECFHFLSFERLSCKALQESVWVSGGSFRLEIFSGIRTGNLVDWVTCIEWAT